MGARGPKPLPSAELRRRGSRRWKERAAEELTENERVSLKELEPTPPPAWLSDEAKDVWVWVDRFLLGEFPKCDEPMLSAFCEAYGTLIQASALVQAEGIVIDDTHNGGRKKHPAFSIISASRTALVTLGAQLGFSPTSRQRLEWSVETYDLEE